MGPDNGRSFPTTAIGDLNNDGNLDLVYSNRDGSLTVRSNYKGDSEAVDETDIVFNPILDSYVSSGFGGRVWPAIANIFRSEKPAILLGNTLGGLHVLKPSVSEPLPVGLIVDVYPNPVPSAESIIRIKVELPGYVQVVSQLGQEIGQTMPLQPFQEYSIRLPALKGIYVLRFYFKEKSITRKIVVN
jgi:hypothetical protein